MLQFIKPRWRQSTGTKFTSQQGSRYRTISISIPSLVTNIRKQLALSTSQFAHSKANLCTSQNSLWLRKERHFFHLKSIRFLVTNIRKWLTLSTSQFTHGTATLRTSQNSFWLRKERHFFHLKSIPPPLNTNFFVKMRLIRQWWFRPEGNKFN